MRRPIAICLTAAVVVLGASCGGGDDDTSDAGATDGPDDGAASASDEATTNDDASATDDGGGGDDGGDDDGGGGDDDGGGGDDGGDGGDDGGGGGGDGSFAVVTVDGTTVTYAMSGIEFEPIEGAGDLTFDQCDPSFFGAGIWAIGYPVDDNGELIMSEDGQNIAGIVEMELPFDDTDPELMEPSMAVEYEPLNLDLRLNSVNIGELTYTIDGNNASGSLTKDDYAGESVTVDFELTCLGE